MEHENTQKTKYCKQCKLYKDINEFSTYRTNNKIRIQTYCKSCKKIIGQQYYHNNKQKYKQHQKYFIEKNPNYQKEYQTTNREYFNNYMKNRYQNDKNTKIIYQLMNELKTNIIIKSNSLEEIIGCDIENLIKWLHFTKRFNIENDTKTVVIEHLNSCCNFDLNNENEKKKYMNWKNLRFMSKSQNSKKNKKINLEDKIRHQYLLHCFIHNKEPTIEVKNIY